MTAGFRTVGGIVVMDRPNDRQLLRLASEQWQMLADENSGRRRGDWQELSSHLNWGFRLQIPAFQMAHPSPAINEDARLGFALVTGLRLSCCLEVQKGR